MNDAELNEAQFLQFMRGWWAARDNEAYQPNAQPEWRDGFAFFHQIRAEKDARPTCH